MSGKTVTTSKRNPESTGNYTVGTKLLLYQLLLKKKCQYKIFIFFYSYFIHLKYFIFRLLEIDSTTTTVRDVLSPFKINNYTNQKSVLPAHWQQVLEQFANTSTYQSAMRGIGK